MKSKKKGNPNCPHCKGTRYFKVQEYPNVCVICYRCYHWKGQV